MLYDRQSVQKRAWWMIRERSLFMNWGGGMEELTWTASQKCSTPPPLNCQPHFGTSLVPLWPHEKVWSPPLNQWKSLPTQPTQKNSGPPATNIHIPSPLVKNDSSLNNERIEVCPDHMGFCDPCSATTVSFPATEAPVLICWNPCCRGEGI